MASTSDRPILKFTDTEEQDATPVQTSADGKKAASFELPVDDFITDQDVEKAPVFDPNIVDWDSLDDPANPLNFSGSVKAINIGIVSVLTFITPLASSMIAPGVPELMIEFSSMNNLLTAFVVSVYVLEFALGPLILTPASELYGRAIIYHICNIGFVIFTIACAVSTDIGMLIAFRFFQGCFGSAPLTNGTLYRLPPFSGPLVLIY